MSWVSAVCLAVVAMPIEQRPPKPTPPVSTPAPNCVNCGAPDEPLRMRCSYCTTPTKAFTRLFRP